MLVTLIKACGDTHQHSLKDNLLLVQKHEPGFVLDHTGDVIEQTLARPEPTTLNALQHRQALTKLKSARVKVVQFWNGIGGEQRCDCAFGVELCLKDGSGQRRIVVVQIR